MAQHKYAHLLKIAAENSEAKFISKQFNKNFDHAEGSNFSINTVLTAEFYDDWQEYKEPELTYQYYQLFITRTGCFYKQISLDFESQVQWDLKITLKDGLAINAELPK